MPRQTEKKNSVLRFPDGCKVEVQKAKQGAWLDVGVMQGDATATLNFDEEELNSANAGIIYKRYKNLKMNGSFTLMNSDPKVIEALGSGVMAYSKTTGAPITSGIDDCVFETIGFGELFPLTISVGGSEILPSAVVVASVTGATDGALTVGEDYNLVQVGTQFSIVFVDAGKISDINQEFTVVLSSVTPLASERVTAGTTTLTAEPYSLRMTHTDSDGKIWRLSMPEAVADSGSFNLGFLGAESDGVNVQTVNFTALCDGALPDMEQLFQWERTL